MKKLLLIMSGGLLFVAGCYREKPVLKASDALIGTPWKIQAHIAGSAEPGVDCRVAQELYFFKDSTGFYYYPTPCDSGDIDTLKFRWHTSTDNKNLYLTEVNGVKVVYVLGISYYDFQTLRMRGNNWHKKFLDGYFMPKPQQ